MVLAGPGSGKTSVIVERTAYMINEGKIPASSILVVTFSRAAATEMKERFLKFVGQDRSEVTFGASLEINGLENAVRPIFFLRKRNSVFYVR